LSGSPLDDGPSERAAVAQRAYNGLVAAVDEMRRALRLNQETPDILEAIRQTMHVNVPPQGPTVIQILCDRERQNVFNEMAHAEFPTTRQGFEDAVQEFVIAREGRAPARKVRKIARNAWKEDPGADHRIRQMELLSPNKWRSPYKGRPELYDPGVVLAFENAIARAIGRSRISWTRGTKDNQSRGVILEVFVATVQWAVCVAWQCSAPAGSKPIKVKAEGILRIVKAQRR